jgi:hypothetical protein
VIGGIEEPASKERAHGRGRRQGRKVSSGTRRAKSLTKRLIVTLGDKGGTGKSFLIRKIAEMHMEAQTPNLLLVDGDASVDSIDATFTAA